MKLVSCGVRKIAGIMLCLMMAETWSLPVLGAESREKIQDVRLTVVCEEKPEAGKTVGTVKVTLSDERLKVTEEARYVDPEDDVWIRGEIPVIRLEIGVKEEEKYRFTSSTKVRASGARSEVKSKRILDGGDGLRVELRLPKVSGDLEEVDEFYWDGRRGRWSEVEGADKYEARLYRSSTLVTTVTTENTSFYFYPYMNRSGEYTFRVRGICSSDGEKGKWTDKSEEFYLSSEDVYTGAVPGGENSGNGPQADAGWIQDQSGWAYRMSDGSMAWNTWVYVDNAWYYMGNDRYMRTGWIFVDNGWYYLDPVTGGPKGSMKTGWTIADGRWYYLDPAPGGPQGSMKTGWVQVNGFWYYLDPVSGGPRGAMKTGYQTIGGKRYYLDPGSGALWTGRYVPNGKWADENGAIGD